MRVTQKGQITIPEDIRIKYGFLPHTEVKFVEVKGKVFIMKVHSVQARGKNIISHLRG
jgi:AbrB family looped-hinge helix DNA binding protein